MIAEVTAGDHVYTVVEDLVTRFQVIFVGNVLDEITGKGLSVPFSVTVDREDLLCRTTAEGLFCIATDVDAVFPDLTIASPAIQMTVQADGYREQSQMIAFSPNPVFPVPVATLDLRRLPVRLQGRVNQEAGANPPIPDAKIMTAAPGAKTALLRAPVWLDHPIGSIVRARPLNAVALAPPRELAAPLSRGQPTLLINNRSGLAAGQILRIGSAVLGQFAIVQSVSPTPANLAVPGEITLELPPNRSFPKKTPIDVFTKGGAGAARQLTRSADPGDGVLLLDGTLSAATIEIVDPLRPSEYHALGALTDTDGYYACDGIGVVAALHLKASATGFMTPAAPVSRILNYKQQTNIVDFRL
jgi:hypothetical protein